MKKKQKDNKKFGALMAVFIAVLMIGSIVGFMWQGDDESNLNYGDYKFKIVGSKITTEINDVNYFFDYHPTDLISLNTSEDAKKSLIESEMVYLTFNPESKGITGIESTRFDLTQEFVKTGKIILNGQTQKSDVYNHPIITCENATEFVPVIYLKEGEETQIYMEGNCIVAEAEFEQAFLALKDKMMYTILGVLE